MEGSADSLMAVERGEVEIAILIGTRPSRRVAMHVDERRVCSLERSAGLDGVCPESIACAFWQAGAEDLDAGCAIERLGLHHLGPDVAEFLLGRRALDERRPEFAR